MPAKSKKQQRFAGAELGRLRAGKKTKTGMSEEQLSDFAKKPPKKTAAKPGKGEGMHMMPGGHMMKNEEMMPGKGEGGRLGPALRAQRVPAPAGVRRAPSGRLGMGQANCPKCKMGSCSDHKMGKGQNNKKYS